MTREIWPSEQTLIDYADSVQDSADAHGTSNASVAKFAVLAAAMLVAANQEIRELKQAIVNMSLRMEDGD